jgi:hypothetical protein
MIFKEKKPTPKALDALKKKHIDHNTAILKDINFLLEYIENNAVEATSKGYYFPRKSLEGINAHLTHPIMIGTKAVNQKHYPHIDGFSCIRHGAV